MADDFNEFLKELSPSEEENKLSEELKKVWDEYLTVNKKASEAFQKHIKLLKEHVQDKEILQKSQKTWDDLSHKAHELLKQHGEIFKKRSQLVEERMHKFQINSEKRQKETDEILSHANDVLSASHKSLEMLHKQVALIEPRRKIRDLLSIIVIILNQKNSQTLQKKFNDKLSQISPLAKVKEEKAADWYVAFETKIESLITLDNFEMLFTLFKNTLIECEQLVRKEENGEFKIHLLNFMIQHIDNWHDSYLEQRLQNIFKTHKIKNKHQMGVFGLFADLYENITAENDKSILTGLLT